MPLPLFFRCNECSDTGLYKQEAASGYWRSESMLLLDLITPRDIAYRTVHCLASLGTVQFVEEHTDQLPAHLRAYASTIRVCEDLERRFRFFKEQMSCACITPVPFKSFAAQTSADDSTDTPLVNSIHGTVSSSYGLGNGVPLGIVNINNAKESNDEIYHTPYNSRREPHSTTDCYTLSLLEESTSKDESDLRGFVSTVERLEDQLVCIHDEAAVARTLSSDLKCGLKGVVGIINAEHCEFLERLIYRISRGNVLFMTHKAESISVVRGDSINNKMLDDGSDVVLKEVFTAFTTSELLLNRMQRVIATVPTVHIVSLADILNIGGPEKFLEDVGRREDEVTFILNQSYNQRDSLLKKIALTYNRYKLIVAREKVIYTALDLLSHQTAFLQGLMWVSAREKDNLDQAIDAEFGAVGDPNMRPVISISSRAVSAEGDTGMIGANTLPVLKIPTYFQSNEYIEVFQNIVDSYGVPRYKEVNPAVFTVITFPYLFGIMFGDIGHGFLLLVFSAFLCIFQEKLRKIAKSSEIFMMVFSGRYLLLAMGFFGIYCGVLYNDFFGMSVGLFKSRYSWPLLPPNGPGGVVRPNYPNGHPSVKPDGVYIFGIDVAWTETENKLEFYNSVKMKAAIIIGVLQMLVGLLLSTMNHIHNKDYKKVLFVSIPEIIFLSCTFGYMGLLIIIKWLTVWDNTHDAPSLLETMTSFFLSPGSVKKPLYNGQATIQVILLLLAFAQVPIMLLVIPLIKRHHAKRRPLSSDTSMMYTEEEGSLLGHRQSQVRGRSHTVIEGDAVPMSVIGPDEEIYFDMDDLAVSPDQFDFSEVMIQYIIHTIEFVLGTVSNTASYLRLWALSLAHSQLSEVFLDFAFCMTLGMDKGNGVVVVLGAGVWLAATIGVILTMETLSAFLHSLRLHWVEFQNKFYAADGVAFVPLVLPQPDND